MAAGDLVDLSTMKSYLQIGVTTYDTLLSSLITQASARICNDCGRQFVAQDYVEFQNTGTRQQRAQVRNKPILRMNSVRWGYSTAFLVNYSGSAASASVACEPIAADGTRVFRMRTIDGTGVHDSTVDISYQTVSGSTKYLCSQLVAAINAVSGFSAQLMGSVDIPTRWLMPQSGLNLKSSNQSFTQGIGWPNVDIFSYNVDQINGTIGFQPLTSMDYFFAPDAQAVTPISFPGMYQGLCLDYRGGYETIPADIVLLAEMVVAEVFNQTRLNTNLSQESLDDYAYTLLDPLLKRAAYADLLAPYRTIALAGGMG